MNSLDHFLAHYEAGQHRLLARRMVLAGVTLFLGVVMAILTVMCPAIDDLEKMTFCLAGAFVASLCVYQINAAATVIDKIRLVSNRADSNPHH